MRFYFFYNFNKPVVVAFDVKKFSPTIDIIRFENILEVYRDIIRYGNYLG